VTLNDLQRRDDRQRALSLWYFMAFSVNSMKGLWAHRPQATH